MGVFDLRTEGQGSAGVTKCIDDDGWGRNRIWWVCFFIHFLNERKWVKWKRADVVEVCVLLYYADLRVKNYIWDDPICAIT